MQTNKYIVVGYNKLSKPYILLDIKNYKLPTNENKPECINPFNIITNMFNILPVKGECGYGKQIEDIREMINKLYNTNMLVKKHCVGIQQESLLYEIPTHLFGGIFPEQVGFKWIDLDEAFSIIDDDNKNFLACALVVGGGCLSYNIQMQLVIKLIKGFESD